jgi:hypothetical protein
MTNETLSWDTATALYTESALRGEGQGYTFRRHADETCTDRLDASASMVFKKVLSTSAAELCPTCTGTVVETAVSSVIVVMRNLAHSLGRNAESHRDPRKVAVKAVKDLSVLTSVHPHFEASRDLVMAEVKRVESALPLH